MCKYSEVFQKQELSTSFCWTKCTQQRSKLHHCRSFCTAPLFVPRIRSLWGKELGEAGFVFGFFNEAESFISISLLWGWGQPCVDVKMWPCWGIFGQPALSNLKPLLVVILIKPHESCWCAPAPELAAGGTNTNGGAGPNFCAASCKHRVRF